MKRGEDKNDVDRPFLAPWPKRGLVILAVVLLVGGLVLAIRENKAEALLGTGGVLLIAVLFGDRIDHWYLKRGDTELGGYTRSVVQQKLNRTQDALEFVAGTQPLDQAATEALETANEELAQVREQVGVPTVVLHDPPGGLPPWRPYGEFTAEFRWPEGAGTLQLQMGSQDGRAYMLRCAVRVAGETVYTALTKTVGDIPFEWTLEFPEDFEPVRERVPFPGGSSMPVRWYARLTEGDPTWHLVNEDMFFPPAR